MSSEISFLQSHWRGRCVRNACKSKAIRLARKNVTLANRNARDDQKLGNRMRTAVDNLFKYKQLAYVLEAVMNIGESCCVASGYVVCDSCMVFGFQSRCRYSAVTCLLFGTGGTLGCSCHLPLDS